MHRRLTKRALSTDGSFSRCEPARHGVGWGHRAGRAVVGERGGRWTRSARWRARCASSSGAPGWTRCGTSPRCAGWSTTPSPTTTSGRCTAGCPVLADLAATSKAVLGQRRRLRAAPAVLRRPDGRGDLGQRARSRLRRPSRGGRADDHAAHPRAGPRPGGADAEVVRPAGRPLLAVRRRRPARRQPAPRRHPRHHPRALVRQHPQVRRQGRLDGRPGPARHPHAPGGAVPRGRGRRRAQRPRRRRHPGREDDDAQLPRCGGPGP